MIAETVVETCRQLGLDLPHLHIEPGRSIVARAGVAIYRVNTVKRQGGRTWLLVDGGMADNPRHALYGARYSCLTVAGISRERSERVHIAGPYCESGDVIIEDLPMPKVEEGELIASANERGLSVEHVQQLQWGAATSGVVAGRRTGATNPTAGND